MHVWQASNVGEGRDIEGSWNEQDVSGLERIWDRTKKMPCVTLKKCQAKENHDVTESVNTFSCLEPACIAIFKTIEEVDEHMYTGHHIMTPEKETIYDNVQRQWAAVMTSAKGAGQKIGELMTEQRVGLKEAESCGENIFGCQRVFDKFIQPENYAS